MHDFIICLTVFLTFLWLKYRRGQASKRETIPGEPQVIRFENVKLQYMEANLGNVEGSGRAGSQAFISRKIFFDFGKPRVEVWEPYLNTKGEPDLRLAWMITGPEANHEQ